MRKQAHLIWVNVAVLAVLFVLVEISGRAYYAITSDDFRFFRESLFVSPWFTTTDRPSPDISIGPNGLLGRFQHKSEPLPAQKPPGEIRIVAMGGSTTKNERAYLSAGIDYARSLETRIQRAFPSHRVTVLNAGSESFSSAHTLVNFALRVSFFEPDLVIVMHNINDRSAAYFGEATFPDYANKYMRPQYLAPEVQRFAGAYGVLVQSRVLSHLGLAKAFSQGDMDVNANVDMARRYFRRNLETIAIIAKSIGSDLIYLTQPHDPLREDEGARSKAAADHDAFNREIIETGHSQGVTVVDMSASLSTDTENFVDPVHYSPKGISQFAAVLSDPVVDILRRRGALRSSP